MQKQCVGEGVTVHANTHTTRWHTEKRAACMVCDKQIGECEELRTKNK